MNRLEHSTIKKSVFCLDIGVHLTLLFMNMLGKNKEKEYDLSIWSILEGREFPAWYQIV